MIKKRIFIFIGSVIISGLMIACQPGSAGAGNSESSSARIVTIQNDDKSTGAINSYQAVVSEISITPRIPGDTGVSREYRLYTRKTEQGMNLRIDFSEGYFGDGVCRSVYSDGKELVVFVTATNQVLERMPVDSNEAMAGVSSADAFMGRIDVDTAIARFRSLSYSIKEDAVGGYTVVEMPADNYAGGISTRSGGEYQLAGTKLLFDMNNDVILGSEMVMNNSDGKTIVNHSYIYQVEDGIPVITGEITEMNRITEYSENIEGSPFPQYNSVDEIPDITEEEIAEIESGEGYICDDNPLLGDQNDGSVTTLTIKTYDQIRLNGTDDSVFRINFID